MVDYTIYSRVKRAVACMQAHRYGVRIDVLMAELGCSRSTLARTLALMRGSGFIIEEVPDPSGDYRRKRLLLKKVGFLSNPVAQALASLSLDERVALEVAMHSAETPVLRSALGKVLSVQRDLPTAAALDLDEQLSRDARVSRVGPRQRVDERIVELLRRAMVGLSRVTLRYRNGAPRLVTPHGFVHSRFDYLVARGEDGEVRTLRLDLITEVRPHASPAEEPEDWNLSTWLLESFGVYHGDERLHIVLHFDAEVADRAARLLFHLSQHLQREPDGTLRVYLHCRGHRELFHELLHPDWNGHVTLEHPASLVSAFREYLNTAAARHRRVYGLP